VSIPAHQEAPRAERRAARRDQLGAESDPQPYLEVKPGDAKYPRRLEQTRSASTFIARANARELLSRHAADIIDSTCCAEAAHAIDGSWKNATAVLPLEGCRSPAWVVTDLTDAPGDWTPRRTDWKSVIVDQVIPPIALKPGESGYLRR